MNKKVLNSLTHLILASFCMQFLLKKKKAMKTKSKRVCVCVVGGGEGSWVIASTAVSSSGTDDRIAVMIWPVSVNHFRHPSDVTPV